MPNEPSPSSAEIDRYARDAAALLRLNIRDEDWPSVLASFQTIVVVASALLDQPLPDQRPPAPVFEASR